MDTARILLFGAMLLQSDCGGGGGYGSSSSTPYMPPSSPPPNTVWVGAGGAMTFTPSTLTVRAGTTVTFVWMSSGHNVIEGTSCTPVPNPRLTSGGIQSSGFQMTWTPQAADVGTVPYFCQPHCASGMTGTLTVTSTAY